MSDLEGHVTSTFLIDDPGAGTGSPAPLNAYNVCDISGFKAKPGELKEQWDHLKVLPEFWEPRNQQDGVRGRAELQSGSPSPEQEDVFLAVNEVTAGSL